MPHDVANMRLMENRSEQLGKVIGMVCSIGDESHKNINNAEIFPFLDANKAQSINLAERWIKLVKD